MRVEGVRASPSLIGANMNDPFKWVTGPIPHDNGSPVAVRAGLRCGGRGVAIRGVAINGLHALGTHVCPVQEAVGVFGSVEGWIAVMLLRRVAGCTYREVPEPEVTK